MDIREIARRAKVSTATVSRAINRIPTVDPQLAKRVWRGGDEPGYLPQKKARGPGSRRNRTLPLVVFGNNKQLFPASCTTLGGSTTYEDHVRCRTAAP